MEVDQLMFNDRHNDIHRRHYRFDGVVGYRICLTHRRSPVRTRAEPFFFSPLPTPTWKVVVHISPPLINSLFFPYKFDSKPDFKRGLSREVLYHSRCDCPPRLNCNWKLPVFLMISA